jgi:hypothetical protein
MNVNGAILIDCTQRFDPCKGNGFRIVEFVSQIVQKTRKFHAVI